MLFKIFSFPFIILIFDTISASSQFRSMYYDNYNGEGGRHGSSRAFTEDKKLTKREGYRYYGAGSKSANSFAPTTVHKSTSASDNLNYFTSKSIKDMDAAGSSGSGVTSGQYDGSYLTVYDPSQSQHSMSMDEAYGDMAAESGHGGGGHGGGHGGGGKGCNSALGLLGVLGLAAYLQNVLRQMQNATGRRKRDVSFDDPFDQIKLDNVKYGMAQLGEHIDEHSSDVKLENDKKKHSNTMTDIFPLLSSVAHAKDGLIPIHCTHSSVCLANKLLVKDLGSVGHSLGTRITASIAKLLMRSPNDEKLEQIRMIAKAGKMGRNGRNCLKVFPTCNRLKNLPTYKVPKVVL